MASKDLSDREYASLAEFRYLLRHFLAFSEGAARGAGLNPQQHQLLLAVRGFGDDAPTVRALAERLTLRHHSTVELLDRLETAGLVRRRRLAGDRRVATVTITARGERVLHKLSLAHREELSTTGPALVTALAALTKSRARSAKLAASSRARAA